MFDTVLGAVPGSAALLQLRCKGLHMKGPQVEIGSVLFLWLGPNRIPMRLMVRNWKIHLTASLFSTFEIFYLGCPKRSRSNTTQAIELVKEGA